MITVEESKPSEDINDSLWKQLMSQVPDVRLVLAIPQQAMGNNKDKDDKETTVTQVSENIATNNQSQAGDEATNVTQDVGAVVHLARIGQGWNMVGAAQRNRDVRFSLEFAIDDFLFSCSIYYAPTSDACVFKNSSNIDLALVHSTHCSSVLVGAIVPLQPGLSYITKANSVVDPTNVLEILVLEKTFAIQYNSQEECEKSLEKRIMSADEGIAAKRLRTGHTDVTKAMAQRNSSGSGRSLYERSGQPLVNLQENDIAIIQDTVGISAGTFDNQTNYHIERRDNIAQTMTASVLVARHEGLHTSDIVTKVMKYERGGSEPANIVVKADNWEREVRMLERLKHVSSNSIYYCFNPH